MEIQISSVMLAAAGIARAARENPNISVNSLRDELERGDIDGWSDVVQRYRLNFSGWSGAMERAIEILEREALVKAAGKALEAAYPWGLSVDRGDEGRRDEAEYRSDY